MHAREHEGKALVEVNEELDGAVVVDLLDGRNFYLRSRR